jgi:hypothetical protein
MSTVAAGLASTLVDPHDVGSIVPPELASIIRDKPWAGRERELRNAFVAVDWAFHRVLASTLGTMQPDRESELREFPQIVDSLHALCAKELCRIVRGGEQRVATVTEEVADAIDQVVWAEAAVAARTEGAHPLSAQVEAYAQSHAFSDPLDLAYLERTGEAVARAVRAALGLGLPVDRLDGHLRDLATRLDAP